MKPPVSVPPEIEHDDERKRPDGEDDTVHVVPTKFDPERETTVPPRPDVGVTVSVGPGPAVTVNVAVLVSAATFVVTVTT